MYPSNAGRLAVGLSVTQRVIAHSADFLTNRTAFHFFALLARNGLMLLFALLPVSHWALSTLTTDRQSQSQQSHDADYFDIKVEIANSILETWHKGIHRATTLRLKNI